MPPAAKPDLDAINRAAKELGLALPVEVKLNGRKGPSMGVYTLLPDDMFKFKSRRYFLWGVPVEAAKFRHVITVKSYLRAYEMGSTLWHELTHALQMERDILPNAKMAADVYNLERAQYSNGTSYSRKPQEVEAFLNEGRNADFPLAGIPTCGRGANLGA